MVPRRGIELWQYQVDFTSKTLQSCGNVPKFMPTNISNENIPGVSTRGHEFRGRNASINLIIVGCDTERPDPGRLTRS